MNTNVSIVIIAIVFLVIVISIARKIYIAGKGVSKEIKSENERSLDAKPFVLYKVELDAKAEWDPKFVSFFGKLDDKEVFGDFRISLDWNWGEWISVRHDERNRIYLGRELLDSKTSTLFAKKYFSVMNDYYIACRKERNEKMQRARDEQRALEKQEEDKKRAKEIERRENAERTEKEEWSYAQEKLLNLLKEHNS